MADIQHKNIAEADLHEPKGASTAAVDTVYVSDGAGSGAWAGAPYRYVVQASIPDVSTADTVYAVAPITGTITKIYSVLDAAITVADATVTCKIAGTNITNGALTVSYSGSAIGDVDTATPTALNTVTAGQRLDAATDGASTTAAGLNVFFVISVGY